MVALKSEADVCEGRCEYPPHLGQSALIRASGGVTDVVMGDRDAGDVNDIV